MTSDLKRTLQLSASIHPLLSGHPPQVQGAALANLMATWLAGHYADSDGETDQLRETLLAEHIEAVRRMIPVEAAAIHGATRR
jgi:hypothetical protein